MKLDEFRGFVDAVFEHTPKKPTQRVAGMTKDGRLWVACIRSTVMHQTIIAGTDERSDSVVVTTDFSRDVSVIGGILNSALNHLGISKADVPELQAGEDLSLKTLQSEEIAGAEIVGNRSEAGTDFVPLIFDGTNVTLGRLAVVPALSPE